MRIRGRERCEYGHTIVCLSYGDIKGVLVGYVCWFVCVLSWTLGPKFSVHVSLVR